MDFKSRLSCSGKTTLATTLQSFLFQENILAYALDGDQFRKGLSSDLDFSREGRKENIRRIGEVAKLFLDASLTTIVAFISPFKKDRDRVRKPVKPGKFIEVYLDCPLEICESRDTKGLYKKARNNEIKDFTGISSPYEPPLSPELILHTDQETVEDDIQKILTYLEGTNVFTPDKFKAY